MALYNIHKRKTLDRLTLTYQLKMREVLRKHTQEQVRDFFDSIQADRRSISPDLKGLYGKVLPVFEDHRDRVIHVGVSDGIQEISPDHELGLWEQFPVDFPIEDSLSVQLAIKRDKIVREVKKTTIKRDDIKPKESAQDLIDAYLKNLKKTYRSVADSWLDGESTINDVISGLQQNLQKTDSKSKEIFQTETTNYFNISRHEYFSDNTSVDYMQIYAVTDGRISNICEERHQAVITIAATSKKLYMPAFHPWCRTIHRALISALSTHKKIIDASHAKWGELPKFTIPDAWHRSRKHRAA